MAAAGVGIGAWLAVSGGASAPETGGTIAAPGSPTTPQPGTSAPVTVPPTDPTLPPTTTTSTTTTTTTTTTIPQAVSADGTWTVIVYAGLDNNLDSTWMLNDMREMRTASTSVPGLTFVVLFDRSTGYSTERLGRLGDWTTAKLIDISAGRYTEIDDWGEANLGDPNTLAALFDAAAEYAPADHYALVFKDHGGGVTFGPDEDPTPDVLGTVEIADALDRGLESSGIGHLDLIGFDTCLMASLEGAAHLHPYTDYYLASEDISYADAWDYTAFTYLGTADAPTVEGLGRALMEDYLDFLSNEVRVDFGTLSLLDLRWYDTFDTALADTVAALTGNLGASAVPIGRIRDRVQQFGTDPNPEYAFNMVDLGQVLRRLARLNIPAADPARRAAQLLEKVVVANATGGASAGARGLSVYFPPNDDGWLLNTDYGTPYQVLGSPTWWGFLDAYFDAGKAIPMNLRPAVTDTTEVTYEFDEHGISVIATFDPATVASVVTVSMWSGAEQPDGSVVFYDETVGFGGEPPEENVFAGVYGLDRILFTDGVDRAYGFSHISLNEDMTFFTLTVPMQYRPPIDATQGRFGDPVDITLIVTYDLETEAFSMGYFSSSGGTAGSFEADPHGLVVPLVAHRPAGGEIEWVPSSDVGLWADLDGLSLVWEDLPPGTPVRCELTVADYGGNRATAVVSTQVP